jgi:hypothetical protein
VDLVTDAFFTILLILLSSWLALGFIVFIRDLIGVIRMFIKIGAFNDQKRKLSEVEKEFLKVEEELERIRKMKK